MPWHNLRQGTNSFGFPLWLSVISYTSIFIYISLNHCMQSVDIILPLGTSLRLDSSLSSSCPHYHFQNPLHYGKQQQPLSCCLHTEDLDHTVHSHLFSIFTSPFPKCFTTRILPLAGAIVANHCDLFREVQICHNIPSMAGWGCRSQKWVWIIGCTYRQIQHHWHQTQETGWALSISTVTI